MASEELRTVFYTTLAAIPAGRYCSYGEIAKLCGVHVRQVLAWLRKLPKDSDLPWYRLITSQRRVADYPGNRKQYRLLAEEGVIPASNGRFPSHLQWPDR
ncbi:MAG: MGMT family protein [Candidatus Thiodiazotropha sp. (ex Troendleina suluensis)]|nr:MGMT family protein [Candidatus Thiodiazotropha sp. (ex Troendleina suluensis)]